MLTRTQGTKSTKNPVPVLLTIILSTLPGCGVDAVQVDPDAADPGVAAVSVDRIHTGSVLIDAGFVAPAHQLLFVRTAIPVRFTFAVNAGEATFDDGSTLKEVVISSTSIVLLPAIKSGQPLDESFVQVKTDDRILFDDLRVATLPAGGIQRILAILVPKSTALINNDEHSAIIDEARFALESDNAGDRQFDQDSGSSTVSLKDICIRSPLGPGWVNWNMASPFAAGYSVKPEGGNSVVQAKASGQDLDWMYNKSWGCGTAYKVPDSCTSTVSSTGSISCCCNWAMMQLGHVCKWINPATEPPAGQWPNCPL